MVVTGGKLYKGFFIFFNFIHVFWPWNFKARFYDVNTVQFLAAKNMSMNIDATPQMCSLFLSLGHEENTHKCVSHMHLQWNADCRGIRASWQGAARCNRGSQRGNQMVPWSILFPKNCWSKDGDVWHNMFRQDWRTLMDSLNRQSPTISPHSFSQGVS